MVVRLVLGVIVALAVVFGIRAKASIALEEHVNTFRLQARNQVLGQRRGLDAIPTEAVVRQDADALAQSLHLTLTEVNVRIERDATPTSYAAGRVSQELGALSAPADIDEEGRRRVQPARTIRTTRLTLTGHVHGEGFLVSVDEDVSVVNEIGFAL